MIESIESYMLIRHQAIIHYKYIVSDIDNPTIVVFPGGPGFGYEMYESQVLPFTDIANILLFDPRGCGQSRARKNAEPFSMDSYVKDARALIARLALPNVIIHGTSYGSMAALNFALKYPEITQQLILISGSPSFEFFDLAKKELQDRGDAEQISICNNHLWPGDFDENSLNEYFRQLAPLYSHTITEKSDNPYNFDCNIAILNRALQTEYDHFDFNDQLHLIQCPTLILAGRHDWITPPELAQKMHDKIPISTLNIFEEAGHSISKDVSEEYQQTINNFLKINYGYLNEHNTEYKLSL